MPIYSDEDVPVLEGDLEDDLPIEYSPEINKSPKQIDNMQKGHAAVLKAEEEEISVFEAFDRLPENVDSETLLNMLSYKRATRNIDEIKEYFNENLTVGNPDDVATNFEAVNALITEEEQAKGNTERQVVDALSGLGVEEIVKQEIEAQLLLSNTLNNMISDYGFFEKAIDLGKAFLPTTIIDNYQLTGDTFGAKNYLRDLVIGMKQLKRNEPDKFNKLFPVFLEQLKEDLPTGKQIAIIGAIASPRGEEDIAGFSDFDVALDIVDIASLGTYSAIKLGSLVSKLNSIKVANTLKNTELAGDINTAALLDETGEVVEKVGIDSSTAYNNSAPFRVDDLDPAYTANLSVETRKRIDKVKAEQRRISEIIASDDGILRENILSDADRAVAENKFLDEMKEQGIDSVQWIEQKPTHTVFTYNVVDPATGETLKESVNMPLKFSDIREVWEKTEEGIMASWLKSPTVWAKNALDATHSAIRHDSTSKRVGSLLQDIQREALKPLLGDKGVKNFLTGQGMQKGLNPLVRRQMAQIDEVLMAGDQYKDASGVRGKVYTADELRGGVVNGTPLNDKQIEVYYNLRNLYDELWTIRNRETRSNLIAQGKGEVNLPDGPKVGTTYSKEGAIGTVNTEGTVRVYHSGIDDVIDIRGEDISRLYEEGYVLSKLDEAIDPLDNIEDLYDLVITSKDKTGELPGKVLHFREGYVPKVNKDSYWFVKEVGPRTVNGKLRTNQVLKTKRFFTSKKEANDWINTLPENERKNLELFFDRQLERQVIGSSQVGSGGGLYTGPRASEDIPFGAEGLPAERLNTYEALSHNIQSLENYISRNSWRMSMQQKWVNSVQAAGLDRDGRIAREGFNPDLLKGDDQASRALKKLGEQIQIWSGFPTKGELWWDGTVSGMMEWALNKSFTPKKLTVRGANYLRNAGDPVSKARGIAFHSLLAWFNPVQLWIQAQGATMAASLVTKITDPLAAPRVFSQQMALGFATMFPNDPGFLKHVANIVSNVPRVGGVLSQRELDKIVKLWKRTGLEDSLLNTADHTAALKGYGIGRDAFRRVAEKGLLFYRGGELFNRRFSFLAALEEKRRKLGHIDLNDKQLKEVLTRANNMMLNMSKANRANWQRGVLAMPTQFLQVQAKFLEEVVLGVGNSFTIGERMKIMAGQLGLFGAAGMPFVGSLGVRWAQESLGMSQAEIENLPPEVVKAINGGFYDWYVYSMVGADVDVAERGAIGAGITEFYTDLIFSESSATEKITGAFGIVPHRFFSATKKIKPMIAGAMFHGADPTGEEIMQAFSAMASITSTWNNAQKGAVMNRLHQLQDSRGKVVIGGKDFDIAEEAMVMLGFQHSEFGRVRERDQLVRAAQDYRTHATQWLVDTHWMYVKALKGADSEAEKEQILKNWEISSRYIYKSLRNEEEVRQVNAALWRKLSKSEDEKTRSIKAYIDEFVDGQVLSWHTAAEALRSNGMITNDLDHIEIQEQE